MDSRETVVVQSTKAKLVTPAGTVAVVQTWQRHVTVCLLFAVIAILIGWDMYAAWNSPHSDTISEVTLSFFWIHPSMPAAVGYLMGHLTWPNNKTTSSKIQRAIILFSLATVAVVMDFAFDLPATMPPIIPFAVFVPLGHILWPQVLQL